MDNATKIEAGKRALPRRPEYTTEVYVKAWDVNCQNGACPGSAGRPCNKPGGGYHASRLAEAARQIKTGK